MLNWLPMHDCDSAWLHAVRCEVLSMLNAEPDGLSEYELMKALQNRTPPLFDTSCLKDPRSLYQSHFCLFHCLYRLQVELTQQPDGLRLEISPLNIKLAQNDGTLKRQALTQPDPLAAWYLDPGNLNMQEEEINDLLAGFWQRYIQGQRNTSPEAVSGAMHCIGCSPDDSPAAMKLAYRRAAAKAHPDRGGDATHFRAVQEAWLLLKAEGLLEGV